MTHTESAWPEPAHAFDIFVIHAAGDADFVRGYLLPALNLSSARVQLIDALPLGEAIVSEIDRGVSLSRFTVAVLSPAYLADRWAVFGEQLASHLSAGDVRVIPLRLLDCELPLRLDAIVSLDFTDPARWETEAGRLRNLLHTAAPVAEHIPCPFPGMRPFAESEASRFFGRDEEIDELVGRLDRGEHEIYVIGPSGSGKSSLIQAGLMHVLDAGSSRLGRSFVVRSMRPGERPADRLTGLLEGDLATPAATIEAFVARHPPAERVLVCVDQLEEMFTLASAAEQQRFIAALRTFRSVPSCSLLLALRADFFGALLDSELGPDLAGRLVPIMVAPLRGSTLAQVIRTPAMRVGVYLDARLCDRLVVDAATEPGALPLVQETLRLLWDRRRQRLLGLTEYEALGEGSGSALTIAIARRADTTMSALTAAQQTLARRILLRLVSFGEGRVDTRRQQDVETLRSATDDDAEFTRVLQQLVENRLVTVDSAATDHAVRADLSHEVLLTGWPALRQWIDRRRAEELERRRLEGKVVAWIERGRGTNGLLDPMDLSAAMQWMRGEAALELGYSPELPSLLAASRREVARRSQQRRRRTLRTVAIAAVALLLILAVWAQQRDARRDTEAHRLLEQGQALVDGHPMRALPYLVAARANGIESAELRALFARASRYVPLFTFEGRILRESPWPSSNVAVSRDGARVVTASDDNTARIWNVSTGKPVGVLLQHRGRVVAAGFSRDGMRVITASADNTARVWDAMTGRPMTPPLVHRDRVVAASFSPDGTRMLTASHDRRVWVWDAATGKPVAVLPLKSGTPFIAARFSSDGSRVVIGGERQESQEVWDATTGKPVMESRERRTFDSGKVFSPDGTRVVTSMDWTVQVWDVTTAKPVTPVFQRQSYVFDAVFSPDGTRVVLAGSDMTAQVWDATTGVTVGPPLQHRNAVNGAAFSPDGTRVVTASKDNTARVWDATTGKAVTEPLQHEDSVTSAAFSSDGTHLITASWDGTARVWDATTGELAAGPLEYPGSFGVGAAVFHIEGTRVVIVSDKVRVWDTMTMDNTTPLLRHGDAIIGATFSPDGKRVVTTSEHNTARMWNATTGKPVTEAFQYRGLITGVAFSSEGARIATTDWNGVALVWDAMTGKPVTPPLRHQRPVKAATFSPDGARVVTASWDNTARVWDATTGEPITAPLEHHGLVMAAAFSFDGTRVITASDDHTARIWDAMTGTPVTPPLQHQGCVNAAAFSPDGMRVITTSEDKTARVWDAATGEPITAPLQHQGSVVTASFSADGEHVVTASTDKTARVWDATTGRAVTEPLEHRDRVTAAAFSPDGTRVITASDDHTARLWDATTGKLVTAPLEHRDCVTAAAFSPDGTRLVTASKDKTARVWSLSVEMGSLEDWRALARCSPFALVDGVLMGNPDLPTVCAMAARTAAQQ